MKSGHSTKNIVILVILTLLLTGNVVFWASQKEGFHIDEMFSYEQVGNTEYPKPELDRPDEPAFNTWHNREYYEDYLTVSTEEAFDFSAFYESASKNTAHPPLYLTLLGMFISAVSPNHFTKWSGIGFNLIFYVMTLVLFYDLCRRVLKKERLALFAVLLCGICVAVVSTAIFIRDYMMLTCFSVAFLDLHAGMLERKPDVSRPLSNRLSIYCRVLLILLLGSLTHYYFVVFAFFVCLVYWLILMFAREKRLMVEYTIACLLGITAYLCIWPTVIRDLFFEHRGAEAISNLKGTSEEYGVHLAHYLHVINYQLMGGAGALLLLLITFVLLVRAFRINSPYFKLNGNDTFEWKLKHREKKKMHSGTYGMEWVMFFLVSVSSVSYLLMVTKIAPVLWLDTYKDARYIYNLFPCFILAILFILDRVILSYLDGKYFEIATWIFLTGAVLLGYMSNGVDYLYKGADAQLALLDKYVDNRAVFISEKDYLCSSLNVYFTKTEAVYQTRASDIYRLSEEIESDESRIIVYVSTDTEDTLEVIQIIKQCLDVNNIQYLFETVGRHTAQVYLVKLQ